MLTSLLVGMTMACGQVPSNTPATPPPAFNYGSLPPAPVNNNAVSPYSPVIPRQIPHSSIVSPYQSQSAPTPTDSPAANRDSNSYANGNGNNGSNGGEDSGGFAKRFLSGYPMLQEWFPKWLGKPENGNGDDNQPEPARRGLPAPMESPPFPSSEWQGYPVVGVPYDSSTYPLMGAIYKGPWGDEIKESRVKAYGWVNASGN